MIRRFFGARLFGYILVRIVVYSEQFTTETPESFTTEAGDDFYTEGK